MDHNTLPSTSKEIVALGDISDQVELFSLLLD